MRVGRGGKREGISTARGEHCGVAGERVPERRELKKTEIRNHVQCSSEGRKTISFKHDMAGGIHRLRNRGAALSLKGTPASVSKLVKHRKRRGGDVREGESLLEKGWGCKLTSASENRKLPRSEM